MADTVIEAQKYIRSDSYQKSRKFYDTYLSQRPRLAQKLQQWQGTEEWQKAMTAASATESEKEFNRLDGWRRFEYGLKLTTWSEEQVKFMVWYDDKSEEFKRWRKILPPRTEERLARWEAQWARQEGQNADTNGSMSGAEDRDCDRRIAM